MTINDCQYRHDTHLECKSLHEAVRILFARGLATGMTCRTARFPKRGWEREYETGEIFCVYFFAPDGTEIGHFMDCLSSVIPALTIFDKRRVWDQAMKEEHAITDIAHILAQCARTAITDRLPVVKP